MKIISPFRDYYDTALAYGFDAERPWRRATQQHLASYTPHLPISESNQPLPEHLQLLLSWTSRCGDSERANIPSRHNPDPSGRWFDSHPLAFMVGSRPIKALWLRVTEPAKARGANAQNPAASAAHSSLAAAAAEASVRIAGLPCGNPSAARSLAFEGPVFDEDALRHWLGPWLDHALSGKERASHSYVERMRAPGARRGLPGQLEWLLNEAPPQGLADAMAASGRACAVAGLGQAASDPRLADYQLFRALDPCACLQEISMAVGNMANPEVVPEPVADRYKISAHGFDRASFRKQPTKSADPRQAKRPHPDALRS